jgi:hypothetical protein
MLASFQSWLKQPFKADMDALHWALFYGLILVIAASWGLVLSAIRKV